MWPRIKKCISEMSGLGRTMPFTFAAFAVASLSMIGAPPVAGFVTKWKLLTGAMEMPAHAVGIMLVLLASTLLNVAYFAPVTYKAFFGKRRQERRRRASARPRWPWWCPFFWPQSCLCFWASIPTPSCPS